MKKVISMIIMLSLVVTMFTCGVSEIRGASKLTDIKEGDWYYEQVITLVDKGIIVGYPDGTFKPQNKMTADQFIKTMIVALGYDLSKGEDYWAQPYIDKARELGLIESYEYTPKSVSSTTITRAQMAKICERTVILLEGDRTYTMKMDIKNATKDWEEIEDSGFEDYVYHMGEVGILTGYPDKNFRPYGTLTRAEAATVIRRIIDPSERVPFEKEYKSDVQIGYGIEGQVTFGITINIYKPLEAQYADAESFMSKKMGINDQTIAAIMTYVKTKTVRKTELEKYWPWGKENIQVISLPMANTIVIRAW